jgi:hypothetical protein
MIGINQENIMAKQITQTVGKYSESHDRMTLTFKFPNGENLRINGSRYRTSISVKAPVGGKSYGPGTTTPSMRTWSSC